MKSSSTRNGIEPSPPPGSWFYWGDNYSDAGGYFTEALSANRGDTKARPLEREALVLSDSVVAISGKWQSERTLNENMTTAGPSRVTVVMQKRGDKWLIVQFHNSPTPKPAV